MPVIRQLSQLPAAGRGGAVAIGNFDGVHLGHRHLVERLLAQAELVGGPALAFTFDPHPVRLLRPCESPPPLTWTERKAELLADLGVAWLLAYPTDAALLQLSARDFFQRIVVDELQARALVEGPNFYFGRNREGNVDRLAEWTSQAKIRLEIAEPVSVGGELVSSSRIRSLLGEGGVAEAARLLGAPYRIRGMVTHGAGRGGLLGFPTANIEAIDTLLPALGVYAGWAFAIDAWRPAAIHLGANPTFGDHAVKVEVHLIDYSIDLYGQPLEVEFMERMRGVVAFSSPTELITQLHRDLESVRRLLGTKRRASDQAT